MVNNLKVHAMDVDLSDLVTWRYRAPHAVFDALRERAPVHWQPVKIGGSSMAFTKWAASIISTNQL